MKRKLLIAVPLLLIVAVVAWFFRPKHETLGEAYVGERTATLWSSVAQVREPLDTLHYGDRVDVVSRRNDSIKVRTASRRTWLGRRPLSDGPRPLAAQHKTAQASPARCPCKPAAAPKLPPIFASSRDAPRRASINSDAACPSRSSAARLLRLGPDLRRKRILKRAAGHEERRLVLDSRVGHASTRRFHSARCGNDNDRSWRPNSAHRRLGDCPFHRARFARSRARRHLLGQHPDHRLVRAEPRQRSCRRQSTISRRGNARFRRPAVRFHHASRLYLEL